MARVAVKSARLGEFVERGNTEPAVECVDAELVVAAAKSWTNACQRMTTLADRSRCWPRRGRVTRGG